MDEKRLDRMEDMLATLISMVGNLNQQVGNLNEQVGNLSHQQQAMQEDLNVVKADLNDVKVDILVVKENQSTLKCENEMQFSEVMKKLTYMQADQDFIWEKTARNERELAHLKYHLHL